MKMNPTTVSPRPHARTKSDSCTPKPEPPALICLRQEQEVNPLLERIRALSATEFVALITSLLLKLGLAEVTWVARGNRVFDMRGRKLWLEGSYFRAFVQARRVKRASDYHDVLVARGSAGTGGPVILISTSFFTTSAREEAAKPNYTPVTLIDGPRLVQLLSQHGLVPA
jgi:restriction endonuclease Mrr